MDSERGKVKEMHDGRLLERNARETCSIVKLTMLSAGLACAMTTTVLHDNNVTKGY